MSSLRFTTTILAAGLLAASACSDSPKASGPTGILAPTPAASATLYGVISKTGRDPTHLLVLVQTDGSQISLVSNAETSSLSALEGAGVEVIGTFDSDSSFDVGTFYVREMHGAAVLDGVILEETTWDAEDAPIITYLLQPSDGSAAHVISPSAEMLPRLGGRMWVLLDDNGAATQFGMIGQ